MAGLQYFDINVPPNGSRNLASEGTYFRYYSGDAGGADSSILVKADTGALATILKPGQSIRLPSQVKEWRISNYANAGTIAGIVVVGDGELNDSQVAGVVSVINGETAAVKAGICFIGSPSVAAVAGQYSYLELWNPAGSGKNLILNKISLQMSTAGLVTLNLHNAALTIGGAPKNKLFGGPAAVGQLATTTNAGALGTGLVATFGLELANASKDFQFSEPLIITPGNGLLMSSQVLNVTMWGVLQWKEE